MVHLRCNTCKARPASVHLIEKPLSPNMKGDIVPGWQLLLHGTESGVEAAKVSGVASVERGPCV